MSSAVQTGAKAIKGIDAFANSKTTARPGSTIFDPIYSNRGAQNCEQCDVCLVTWAVYPEKCLLLCKKCPPFVESRAGQQLTLRAPRIVINASVLIDGNVALQSDNFEITTPGPIRFVAGTTFTAASKEATVMIAGTTWSSEAKEAMLLRAGTDLTMLSAGSISIKTALLNTKIRGLNTMVAATYSHETEADTDIAVGGSLTFNVNGATNLQTGECLSLSAGGPPGVRHLWDQGKQIGIEKAEPRTLGAGASTIYADGTKLDLFSPGKMQLTADAIKCTTTTNMELAAGGDVNVAASGTVTLGNAGNLVINTNSRLNITSLDVVVKTNDFDTTINNAITVTANSLVSTTMDKTAITAKNINLNATEVLDPNWFNERDAAAIKSLGTTLSVDAFTVGISAAAKLDVVALGPVGVTSKDFSVSITGAQDVGLVAGEFPDIGSISFRVGPLNFLPVPGDLIPAQMEISQATIAIEVPATNIIGLLSVEGDTDVTGAFEVEGETSINGNFNVEGASEFTGNINIIGAAEVPLYPCISWFSSHLPLPHFLPCIHSAPLLNTHSQSGDRRHEGSRGL